MRMLNIDRLREQLNQIRREDVCLDTVVPQEHNESEWGENSARYIRLVTWTRDFRNTAGFEFMVRDTSNSQRRLVYQSPLWLHKILSGRHREGVEEFDEYPGDEVLYWLSVHAAASLAKVDSKDVRWYYRTYNESDAQAMDIAAAQVVFSGSDFQMAPALWYDMCQGLVYVGISHGHRKCIGVEEFTAMKPETVLIWANSREFHRGQHMVETIDPEEVVNSPAGIRQVRRRRK